MTDSPTTEPTPEEADAEAPHDADRPPTPDEEAAAEQAASSVDPASADAYREAAERGAHIKGEGEIVPERES